LDFLSNPSDFHGIDDVSSIPDTPTPQNYAPNEVSRPKSFPRKKTFFFQKSFFRTNFHIFRDLKIQKFEILVDLADLAMCTSLPYGLPATTPILPGNASKPFIMMLMLLPLTGKISLPNRGISQIVTFLAKIEVDRQ